MQVVLNRSFQQQPLGLGVFIGNGNQFLVKLSVDCGTDLDRFVRHIQSNPTTITPRQDKSRYFWNTRDAINSVSVGLQAPYGFGRTGGVAGVCGDGFSSDPLSS